MDVRLRAFLSECQGLNAFCDESSASVLSKNGWARSVGGANPYLTLYARNRASRASVESDVASMNLHEFASARGCTYVLPAEHFQVGIKCGQGFNADSAIRTAKNKLGVTDAEVEALKEGILIALAKGPLGASDLKEPLGALYKNFGEAGKKAGQTSNVSLGLLSLQAEAKIRRVSNDGRLDGQSYLYRLFENPPVVDDTYPQTSAFRDLAGLFWGWCGLASMAHFQWFSGLGVKAASLAVEGLKLEPVAGSSLLGRPSALEAYRRFVPPEEPVYRLIGGLDSLFLLRRDLSFHIDRSDSHLEVLSGGKMSGLGSLDDLSSHAIVDRGRLVGLWEYDFEAKEIVAASFVGFPDALVAEICRVETYIREELGDARSFSLDSPKSRKPSLERLRKLASA